MQVGSICVKYVIQGGACQIVDGYEIKVILWYVLNAGLGTMMADVYKKSLLTGCLKVKGMNF